MTPERPLFFGVRGVWGFYVLAAVAVGVCGYGVAVRVRGWRRGVGGWPRPRAAALPAAAWHCTTCL